MMTIIFKCYSGSKLYGTDTPESDTDMNGVHLPSKSEILLDCQKHHIRYSPATIGKNTKNDEDISTVSLLRFFEDIRRGKPQSIEMLFASAEYETILWVKARAVGLSLLTSSLSGFTGMAFNLNTKTYKDYYHKLRSLLLLEELHKSGTLTFPISKPDREILIKVKNGEFAVAELDKEVVHMEKVCNYAKEKSVLPSSVDMNKAYNFVEEVYRDIVNSL